MRQTRKAIMRQGTQRQAQMDSFCPVDGCYRETVSPGSYCLKHKRQFLRTGSVYPTSKHDWVSDPAGAACQICGRSVYEHKVGEFCLLKARAS